MALSSIKNDKCRIEKQLQEMTGLGRYMNDTPGPGSKVEFQEDAHLRLQKWGTNLHTNVINLESDLLGLTRNLNRDCQPLNNYVDRAVESRALKYGSAEPFTEETRATNPAWTARDVEQNYWVPLLHNPQNHVYAPFEANNVSTRVEQKKSWLM